MFGRQLFAPAPRTIAVIGNGDIDASRLEEIDAHDLVIRFNAAGSCGVAGKRTDILIVNPVNDAGRAVLSNIRPENFSSLGAIWFSHGKRFFWSRRSDVRHEIRALFPRARVHRFPFRASSRAKKALRAFGFTGGKTASTGAILLTVALDKWPTAKLVLYGFGHQGWEGHDWAAERAFVDSLVGMRRAERR